MPGRERGRKGSLFEREPATVQEVDASIFGGLAVKDRARALRKATIDGRSMQIGTFRFEATRLVIETNIQPQDWESIGDTLLFMGQGAQWWIGDWLAYGEHVWGRTYQEVAARTRYSPKTLKEWTYVARNVDSSIRMDELTFGHHQLVAGLSQQEQVKWLRQAALQDWSISQLRKALSPSPTDDDDTSPTPGTREHFSALASATRKAGQGDRESLKKMRDLAWDILRLADEWEQRDNGQ